MKILKLVSNGINNVYYSGIKKASKLIERPEKAASDKSLSSCLDIVAQHNRIFVEKNPIRSWQEKTCEFIKELSAKETDTTTQIWNLSNGALARLKIFNNTQRGSNRGFYVIDTKTQELFYAKFPNETESTQANTEVFASKVYELLGLNVPEMQLIKTSDGQIGIISKYIPDLKPIYAPDSRLNDGFGADVFLANWDAVISNNAQAQGNKIYRIDFGGSLNYRAQGKHKQFRSIVDELTTMIDFEKNCGSAKLFSTMTKKELVNSLERVVNIDEDLLRSLALSYKIEPSILNTLLKRKEFLSYALEIIRKAPDNVRIDSTFMQEVKNTILSTPLEQFESYRLKNGIKIRKPSLLKKIGIQISRKKKSSLIQKMTEQREKLDDESLRELRIMKSTLENASKYIRTPFYAMVGDYNYDTIKKLDNAIAKCEIPQKTTLYRGTNTGEFIFDDIINSNEFLNAFYKDGDYFTIETYPCTSLSEKVSKSFINNEGGLLFKINVPKGTHGVYMEGMPDTWSEKNEEEILLARDLIYRFKSRTPYFTRDEIELDIIPFDKLPKQAKVHNYQREVQKIKENGTFAQTFPTGEINANIDRYTTSEEMLNEHFNEITYGFSQEEFENTVFGKRIMEWYLYLLNKAKN